MADQDDSSGGLMGNASAAPATSGISGGLMGTVNGLARLADPQLLMSLGFGLMSGARYGSNAGQGLLEGLNAYHQMKTSDLQNQLQRQQLQAGALGVQQNQFRLDAARKAWQEDQAAAQMPQGGLLGMPDQGTPQVSAPNTPFLPGISLMPTGQAAAPSVLPSAAGAAPQGSPAWLAPPSSQQIYGTTYPGGAGPNYTRAMAMFSQDPAAALGKAREDQLKLAQQNYAPQIQTLNGVVQSNSPTRDVKADPQLLATWQHYAIARGLDPDKDFNEENVRQVMGGVANAYRANLSLATEASTQWRTENGPLGSVYQTNPVTGERKQVKGEESLEDVDLGGGQHALVPTSQAAGKPKYSPYGIMDDTSIQEQAQAIAAYRQAPFTGNAARSPQAAAVMKAVYQLNPTYDATQFGAKGAAVRSFMAGKDGQTLDSVNTAVAHLQQLRDLSAALQNGNMTAINAARQTVSRWFGSDVPTNFDAVRNLAAGEVNKIATGGPGAEGDRDAARNSFLSSASPQQLTGAIDNVTGLMAGRLNSVRLRFRNATKMGDDDFDQMLLPETRAAMASHGGTASGNSGGGGTAPVRVNSPQEALKLAPGTVFMTPDGRLKVR